MSALDDRLRSAAEAVHQQTERLSIPANADEPEQGTHHRTRPSRALVGVAAVVVVVVLVASVASVAVSVTRSGSHGGGTFTIEALAATTEQSSVRFTFTAVIPAYAGNSADTVVETGVIDYRHHVGRTDIHDAPTPDGVHTVLTIGRDVYQEIDGAITGPIPPALRKTKRWIETKSRPAVFSPVSPDPFSPLANLGHATIHDRGMTRIGNVAVHHYAATAHSSFKPKTGPTVALTIAMDLYVDQRGRLVRLREIPKVPGQAVTVPAQMDFSDYGVNVNVTAPPAREVYVAP